MRIETSIRSDRDVRKYVPGWRTNMRYQERGLVHNNNHNYVTYVTKQDKESINSTHSLSFKFTLILKKIYLMSSPTIARLFCMNQFHKLHHLELRNLILTYFKNIFKKQRKCKSGLPETKWQPNFIENESCGTKRF